MINQQPSRSGSPTSPRPPSPSQTYHPSILPLAVPTPALLESLAGAAHYSSVNVEPDSVALRHRYSSEFHRRHSSPTPVSADHEGVMEDLKELYCCAPTTENLDQRWRKDAIFEDPWSRCEGFDEYAARWFCLAKLCSGSKTISCRTMSSTQSPNRIVYAQKQEYTIKLLQKKTVESIIIVDLDDDDKIVRVIDQWNGNALSAGFGALFLRRLCGRMTPWFAKVSRIQYGT